MSSLPLNTYPQTAARPRQSRRSPEPDQSAPDQPLIAVLLAVYNGAATLDLTMQSLYRQTCPGFTVVAVNDGSVDQTGPILARWQQKFSADRFRLITNSHNLGLTASLNIGLRFCHTQYVARLDADDVWSKDKLARQLNVLENNPAIGVVGCWYRNFSSHSTRTFTLPITDFAIKHSLWRLNPFGHSCVVIRRRLLTMVGGYNPALTYSQDRDLWFRLMPLTSFYNLPYVLCQRQLAGSISQTRYRQQMWQSFTIRLHYARLNRAPISAYIPLLLPLVLLLQPAWLKNKFSTPWFYRRFSASASASASSSLPAHLPLGFINDRPLIPHRGETIARRAMARAFASHPSIAPLTVFNTTPLRAFFLQLPPELSLLYLRCGAVAAAAIILRCFFSARLIMLEVHNLSPEKIRWPARCLYRLAAKRCDLCITIDPLSASFWLKLGVGHNRIIELPSGTDLSARLTPAARIKIRSHHNLPRRQPLVVYSGNLYRDRGIELILQAAYRLRRLPIHFVFAGGSPVDVRIYRRYLNQLGPDQPRVSWLGFIPHRQVLPLLASSDLALVTYTSRCPTINTMSPLKFWEAIASGTPVLAADFPRLRHLASSHRVTFYHPDNLNDLTDKIYRLINQAPVQPFHYKSDAMSPLNNPLSSPPQRSPQGPAGPTALTDRPDSSLLTWSDRVAYILSRVLL